MSQPDINKENVNHDQNQGMNSFQHIKSGVARIFSGGGAPWPLKSYHSPPAGGPGAVAPRTLCEGRSFSFSCNVSIFKTIKRIRKWINFQQYQNFSSLKIHFFLRKISNNWTSFTKFSEFFSTNNFKNLLDGPYESREITYEFYYLVDKFIKKLKMA